MANRKRNNQVTHPDEIVMNKIYLIRKQKVMIDRDLAELYGVETRVLNQAVRRNPDRFPGDFMFQLSDKEFKNWKSQFVISNSINMGMRKAPLVFTEHGVLMLSSVLNSQSAIQVNIQIMRIYTRLREMLYTHKDILLKMEEMNKKIGKQDKNIQLVFDYLNQFIHENDKNRKLIGFRKNNL